MSHPNKKPEGRKGASQPASLMSLVSQQVLQIDYMDTRVLELVNMSASENACERNQFNFKIKSSSPIWTSAELHNISGALLLRCCSRDTSDSRCFEFSVYL